MSVLIPEGSIYAEPAEHVRALGYTIVYVDTNIGTFEALRWRGRRETTRSGTVWGTADYLVVDVYRDAPADRVVVTVVAQTVTASHTVRDFPPYAIQAAGPPSTTVRRDAEALLRSLGCTQVQSEQRLTGVYGPRIDVKCEDSPEG